MAQHRLKTWSQYYREVIAGTKTFEIRLADCGVEPGDEVTLYEWNRDLLRATGSERTFVAGYVFHLKDFARINLPFWDSKTIRDAGGLVVISLLPMGKTA